MLKKDKADMNRELIQKNEAYEALVENVKILSTCLQEEKARFRNADERLRIKADDTRKMSAQLGSLRQQYEELRQEKNALEKTRSLEDFPSLRFTSQRTVSSERNRSGGSNRSRENARYGSSHSNTSPYNSRNCGLNIHPENRPHKKFQNNLSLGDQDEQKLSNIPGWECPRCWQTFQMENVYLMHLQSCID
ncbi:uncharacterized protein LOC132731787 [Ruditapes philippinarum]|uniref:uncharacterized protein LOC132731787 n=1 Tax=Ruditapes philippinarum TaxID=129788 RepID=UPI00295B5CD4|nr:uncharacterized protein LOC132731787 [Ruditapes philippinarum]